MPDKRYVILAEGFSGDPHYGKTLRGVLRYRRESVVAILDTTRAQKLTEELLASIRDSRAKVVILDVTGVPAVDSAVANHLLQTAEASRLMGAQVIVTGLSSNVAQALVTLGVDLTKLNAVGDLQGGIEFADRIMGYRVVADGDEMPEVADARPDSQAG